MTEPDEPNELTRRDFVRTVLRYGAGAALGGSAAAAVWAGRPRHMVWQIDPAKCIQCGNCATYCVLGPSAVKCFHSFEICGYCEPCFGYFDPQADDFPPGADRQLAPAGAEDQLCPTGAIRRWRVEQERYEYTIDPALCIGCGKCVKGCNAFGNGAFFLQIDHSLCTNCNECAIAAACPSQAFVRVPATQPYLWKDEGGVQD